MTSRCEVEHFTTVADFTVTAGQRVAFTLTHAASHLPLPQPPDPLQALDSTEAAWTAWSGRCIYQGEWRDLVQRSLRLTLKALTYRSTGGNRRRADHLAA